MLYLKALLLSVLVLKTCCCSGSKSKSTSTSFQLNPLQCHKTIAFSDSEKMPTLFTFYSSKDMGKNIDFIFRLTKDPSNTMYIGEFVVPVKDDGKSTDTDKSKDAPVSASVRDRIFLYSADVSQTKTTTFSFKPITGITNVNLPIKHGMLYVLVNFSETTPAEAKVDPVVVTLDKKYNDKCNHKTSSSSSTVNDVKLNLDRVDLILDAFNHAIKMNTAGVANVAFLVFKPEMIFRDNTYSYIIIGILGGLDLLFIAFYIVVMRQKKNLNEILEKDEAAESRLDVEHKESSEQEKSSVSETEQSATES